MDEPSSESAGDPASETTGPRGRDPDEAFCRDCGAVISRKAEICPECGVRQRDPPTSGLDDAIAQLTQGGNPFVAAVLSAIVPGLGQIYNRELEKGLAIIVAGLLALFSTVVLIGIVLYPIVWLYAIYDAYTVADRRSEAAEPVAVGE